MSENAAQNLENSKVPALHGFWEEMDEVLGDRRQGEIALDTMFSCFIESDHADDGDTRRNVFELYLALKRSMRD